MSLYYQDPTYVMLIDVDQAAKIDHAMLNDNPTLTLKHPVEYWSDISRRFLLQYNARYGEVIKKYNPYVWQRELIFDTEQDAVMFCLKVL
jgi:hypothetical protein